MSLFQDYAGLLSLATLVISLITMVLVVIKIPKETTTTPQGFRGGLVSEVVKGGLTAGSGMRMQAQCRSDGPAGSPSDCDPISSFSGFLGGAEPPVFYDHGDKGARYRTEMGAVKQVKLDEEAQAEYDAGRDRFRGGRRQQVFGLSPY